MTEQAPEVPKRKPVKQADSLEQLQALIESMTDEQREKLQRAGVAIPAGSLTSISDDTFKWGVRCTKCNQIALYFVGEKWTVNGVETDMPPPLPHNRVMWTQKLAPGDIDRHSPSCQHCGVPVALNPDGSFARERNRIVIVQEFEDGRDKSFDKKFVRETMKRVAAGGVAEADLSQNYNSKDEPVSVTMTRQRGESVTREIEFVAAQTGADQFGRAK